MKMFVTRKSQTISRDMATVDRVEVLTGPSALFFGSTAPGGMVNYLGKQPQFNERRALSLSVDDSGVARAEIDLAGRFGAAGNAWAYRVVAAGQDGEEPVARLPQRRHTALGAIAWRYANDAQLLIETEWMQNRTPFVFGTVIVDNGDTAQVQPIWAQPLHRTGSLPAATQAGRSRIYSFSVSPPRGCHTISRRSMRPTAPSSASAKPVSTRMPAITVFMSNTPSAWWIR